MWYVSWERVFIYLYGRKRRTRKTYWHSLKRKVIYLTGILVTLMLVAGFSTRKNTAGTRFYHALTTRYNVYFNGNEAYKAGLEAQQQGNKDNYMEVLPLYPIGNKETTSIGTSDFDRAIEKAQKAIRQHSIKRRPIRKPGRAYTDEYKKWSRVQPLHTPRMAVTGQSAISERRLPGSCINILLHRTPLRRTNGHYFRSTHLAIPLFLSIGLAI